MKRAIINLSTGHYVNGQERLVRTLSECNADLLFFQNESEINAPRHKENPYAFKTYAFKHALNLGYNQILWLDASIYAIKKIDSVWDIISREGHIMQYAGWNCGQWANDKCLDYFNLSRDEAMKMPMYGNAGLLGLDFTNTRSYSFFEKWHKASEEGIFIGEWTNKSNTESNDIRCLGHRHDMVVGSIIANYLKMDYIPTDQILHYGSAPYEEAMNETICLKAYGI